MCIVARWGVKPAKIKPSSKRNSDLLSLFLFLPSHPFPTPLSSFLLFVRPPLNIPSLLISPHPTFPSAPSFSQQIECMGWAWAGGGRWVERVEVSTTDGATWHSIPEHNMSPKELFAWRLWKFSVPVPQEGWVMLCVRAFDCSANSQPATERQIWNWNGVCGALFFIRPFCLLLRTFPCSFFACAGYLNSAYHSIKIYSANTSYSQTAKRLAMLAAHGGSLEPLKKTLPFDPELEDPADKFEEGRRSPFPGEV